jgi:hypothetical protein
MNKIEHFFFQAGVFVVLVHLFRNISEIYYLVLGFVLLGFLILSFLHININFQKISLIIIASLTYVVFASLMTESPYSIVIGVARLFYLSPVIVYFFSKDFNNNESLFFWKIILWFTVASSLSILLQYFTGPIAWFADHSERAGTDRFASLAGSLTVYGSLVGVAIALSGFIYKRAAIYIGLIFLLCLGALLSLQKMAFFSMALSIIFVWAGSSNKISVPQAIFLFLVLIVTGLLLYFILLDYFPEHWSYISLIFTADASAVGDVSVGNSIIDRMTHLPFEAFSHWGYLNALLGVGVYGGSGGLGYPDLPMTHNLIAEVFLIFGLILGALIVFVIFKYLMVCFRFLIFSSNLRVKLASSSFLIVVLTSLFSGGLFYQPVIGLIFWFSLSELYKLSRNVKV